MRLLKNYLIGCERECSSSLKYDLQHLEDGQENHIQLYFYHFEAPLVHGHPCQKLRTSSEENRFFCGPNDGEKVVDSQASRPGHIWPNKFSSLKLSFFPDASVATFLYGLVVSKETLLWYLHEASLLICFWSSLCMHYILLMSGCCLQKFQHQFTWSLREDFCYLRSFCLVAQSLDPPYHAIGYD